MVKRCFFYIFLFPCNYCTNQNDFFKQLANAFLPARKITVKNSDLPLRKLRIKKNEDAFFASSFLWDYFAV